MANRQTGVQSLHDKAVYTARGLYVEAGKKVWINPGSQQNKTWGGYYIDVIVASDSTEKRAWITEIETEDSVSMSEAQSQWKAYGKKYSNWNLAVPIGLVAKARQLLKGQGVSNCTVHGWGLKSDGTIHYLSLPGLNL